jgi:sigma-B regulation protein RsbU (phosphoserine phosphatase)
MNRIVVIEDDPTIRRGLTDNLRAQAYEVTTSSNGEEGYRLVLDSQPDLVILDLSLPRMNGYDVCRRIRSHGMATPILMLTAEDRETSRVEGFDAGADDYVTKPFSVRELMGRVRAILRRSEGRSDLANQKELDDARQIQQRLMPTHIPQLPGFQISGVWQPARIVSGDSFDVLRLDENSIAVCIADVCGKGMPAAMMMANLQAAVKTCASKNMRPKELCETVNRIMCGNMAEGFITFFYAVIENNPKRITYCNAGHNPPIFVSARPGREVHGTSRLSTGGGVLGILSEWRYEEAQLEFAAGDHILMYTDGITETRNSKDEEFGEDRLIELVCSYDADADTLTARVIAAASEFSNGNFSDDLTVVAISVD